MGSDDACLKEIFWISPVVNAIFFLSLALICSLVARFVPRLSGRSSDCLAYWAS